MFQTFTGRLGTKMGMQIKAEDADKMEMKMGMKTKVKMKITAGTSVKMMET